MGSIRFNPHLQVRADQIRSQLYERDSLLDGNKLANLSGELERLQSDINDALTDPATHNREGLERLRNEVCVLEGKLEVRMADSALYRLTDRAISLWLQRPRAPQERADRVRQLKEGMADLSSRVRFGHDERRFVQLFHACVSAVEEGVLPSHVDHVEVSTRQRSSDAPKTPANIISIDEVKRSRANSLDDDAYALAETLYPMAELIYRGDYTAFFEAYNELSSPCKEGINSAIFECDGDLVRLAQAKGEERDRKNEVAIARGVIGFANQRTGNILGDSYFPSALDIHQMFIEATEANPSPLDE